MSDGKSEGIYYFSREGKQNLRKTITLVGAAAARWNLFKVVMFTADGDGPLRAAKSFAGKEIQVIACTFPRGTTVAGRESTRVPTGIPDPNVREQLQANGVEIVQAGLPFDDAFIPGADDSKLKTIVQTMNLVSGGLSLCIQAVIMATEAGLVSQGEPVIAMSADTAIVATGARKQRLFAPDGLVVQRFICKPEALDISRQPKPHPTPQATS